jgi:hypothetical protein
MLTSSKTREALTYGAAVVGMVVTGYGVVRAPILTIAAFALIGFGTWAVFKPFDAACTLAFLTAAFPKAGVKVGGFPFPIFLFGLLVAVVLLRTVFRSERRKEGTVVVLVMLSAWLAWRISIYYQFGVAQIAAFVAWSVMPIAVLALVGSLKDVPVRFRRSIEWGFLLSVVYAAIQFATSVDAVSVPGLTYALGDDLTQKNNVIYATTGADFSKIPSTYQNGNIYGLVAAVLLVMALRRLLERRGTRLDAALVVGGAFAIAVSGSRMAIVAGAVALAVLMLGRGGLGRKVGALVALAGVAALAVTLQPGLLERYSVTSLVESGGAGRSVLWRSVMERLTTTQWLIGTNDQSPIEGWPGLVTQLGLIGIVLLALGYWVLAANRREWWPVAVVLVVGAFFDSAYLLFPTWFLPAALLTVPDRVALQESVETPSRVDAVAR